MATREHDLRGLETWDTHGAEDSRYTPVWADARVGGSTIKVEYGRTDIKSQDKTSRMGPRSGNSSDLQPPLVSAGDGMHFTVSKRFVLANNQRIVVKKMPSAGWKP